MKCLNCPRETTNPRFCSLSCAASHNNGLRSKPGVATHNKCRHCGRPAKNSKSKLCRSCYDAQRILAFGMKTISDFTHTASRHKHQNIRIHAHRVAAYYGLPKRCVVCGYDTHVELAHLRPISTFAADTKLQVVNALDNIRYLCPNHHWELEHGVLEIDPVA